MKTITEYQSAYASSVSKSKEIGKELASSISMLQLDVVKETLATSVVEIESLSNKSTSKSVLEKLPGMGRWFTKAKEKLRDEQLQNGSMSSAVDRLFKALNEKKQNIEDIAETMFRLKKKLAEECSAMEALELDMEKSIDIEELKEADVLRAKGLLTQIKPNIIKAKDRQGVITATIASAEQCALQISAMLPMLESEMITELTIQGGLQELKEFKSIYDSTVEIIEDINEQNEVAVKEVLLDVVDMAIVAPTSKALAQLESRNKSRLELQDKLNKKLEQAKINQDSSLKKFNEIRANQNLLESK